MPGAGGLLRLSSPGLLRGVAIPEDVRRQAIDPWTYLPLPPGVELVPLAGAAVMFNSRPGSQYVRVDGDGPSEVAAVVDAARAAARARNKTALVWYLAPGRDELAAELERCGLVNRDPPGLEAMALVAPPNGPVNATIDVRLIGTWADYRAAHDLQAEVFELPEESERELQRRFEAFTDPGDRQERFLGFLAFLDGQAAGSAYALCGDSGLNLFGGAVREQVRGRGVYRALVQARWEYALERRRPALTVQAGRMSRPVLERLGFSAVGTVSVYVDELA
jgi:GNAT superfamily N-acetyltransferase